jgi:predicted transposase YbfD/YdcC
MSLKKYNCCDEGHSSDFEYVCLKEKRVFCIKCWFKLEHFRHCQSSRCGQYHKIAHLALNRALEYKNSKIMEEMCANQITYEALRVRFLQLNFQVTEILKDFVEQKMPLLFWGTVN